jgi:hypothetical protein
VAAVRRLNLLPEIHAKHAGGPKAAVSRRWRQTVRAPSPELRHGLNKALRALEGRIGDLQRVVAAAHLALAADDEPAMRAALARVTDACGPLLRTEAASMEPRR